MNIFVFRLSPEETERLIVIEDDKEDRIEDYIILCWDEETETRRSRAGPETPAGKYMDIYYTNKN